MQDDSGIKKSYLVVISSVIHCMYGSRPLRRRDQARRFRFCMGGGSCPQHQSENFPRRWREENLAVFQENNPHIIDFFFRI